jgi:cell division topological specificity factor
VIKKYVEIDDEKVQVQLDRGNDVSTLEVNIELPEKATEHRGNDRRRRTA